MRQAAAEGGTGARGVDAVDEVAGPLVGRRLALWVCGVGDGQLLVVGAEELDLVRGRVEA